MDGLGAHGLCSLLWVVVVVGADRAASVLIGRNHEAALDRCVHVWHRVVLDGVEQRVGDACIPRPSFTNSFKIKRIDGRLHL